MGATGMVANGNLPEVTEAAAKKNKSKRGNRNHSQKKAAKRSKKMEVATQQQDVASASLKHLTSKGIQERPVRGSCVFIPYNWL